MKKYKVITPYDCLVVCDGKEIFLSSGQSLQFDKACSMSVYPTIGCFSPSFILNLEDINENRYYTFIDCEDERIFYLLNGQSCENYIISSLTINENKCNIELGENKIIITYLQYKKVIHLNNNFDKFKTGTLSNCCYLLITNKEEQNLILFNTLTGNTEFLSGQQIKISANNVLVVKNLDNIARHIIEEEYIVTEEGLVTKSKNIQYQNGRPTIVTVAQTVPYAFLEAIQIGDLELATSYLDLNMRRRIDEEHLREYFGKIKWFFALDTQSFIVHSKKGKSIYKFSLLENKISEIESL